MFVDVLSAPDIARMQALSAASIRREDADRLAHLNIDDLGRKLTLARALTGPNAAEWRAAHLAEMKKLIPGIMHAVHLTDIAPDRRRDIIYFNPVVKEKLRDDSTIDYRVRGTVGGDTLKGKLPFDTSAFTAELEVVKILLQSSVSDGSHIMTLDLKDYYLNSPMHRPEYLRISKKHLTPDLISELGLTSFVNSDGSILFAITKGIYGLPHAGALAQEHLIPLLAQHGYHQSPNVPCLFRHDTNGVSFTLVVDDFAVKYKDRASAEHLLSILRTRYTLTEDWDAKSYLGMALRFFTNSDGVRCVGLSMPGYVAKALQRFRPNGVKGAASPSIYEPVHQYGSHTPQQATTDTTARLTAAEVLELQQVVGVFLYYTRAVDLTMLTTVCELAATIPNATQLDRARMERFLEYAAAHPDHELVLAACDMILYTQSDAGHLSRVGARSVAGGLHYLSNINQPLMVNGGVAAISKIIPAIVASAAEAEYAALFLNAQIAAWLRTILVELGYPQPPTLIMTDNATAVGIATGKCKIKRSKPMDMRWHWIRDRVQQGQFSVHWISGAQNLADFFTKSLPVHKHREFAPLLAFAPPTMLSLATVMNSRASRALHWRTKLQPHKSVFTCTYAT
jgi:hypothetical protein